MGNWTEFCDHHVAVIYDRPRLAAKLRDVDPSVLEFAGPFIAWLYLEALEMTVDDPIRLQSQLLADWGKHNENNQP